MLVNDWQFPALAARKGNKIIHRFNRRRQWWKFITLIEEMRFLEMLQALLAQRLEDVEMICRLMNEGRLAFSSKDCQPFPSRKMAQNCAGGAKKTWIPSSRVARLLLDNQVTIV